VSANSILSYNGDPRGHWEGDTLVVDTTNFTDRTKFKGADENLHLRTLQQSWSGDAFVQVHYRRPDRFHGVMDGRVAMPSAPLIRGRTGNPVRTA
jgi:hypothetical protein